MKFSLLSLTHIVEMPTWRIQNRRFTIISINLYSCYCSNVVSFKRKYVSPTAKKQTTYLLLFKPYHLKRMLSRKKLITEFRSAGEAREGIPQTKTIRSFIPLRNFGSNMTVRPFHRPFALTLLRLVCTLSRGSPIGFFNLVIPTQNCGQSGNPGWILLASQLPRLF